MSTTAEVGNFSSLYHTLLQGKEEIVFGVHMLFKYVPTDEIPAFMLDAGCPIIKDPDVPLADFVCQAFRWLNKTGRAKYFLNKLEGFCERRGKLAEFRQDRFAEIDQYDGMEFCC